jgi:hypothetical protein
MGAVLLREHCAVGERSLRAEAGPARASGLERSVYVGISNEKAGENPARRKPKVSSAMLVS